MSLAFSYFEDDTAFGAAVAPTISTRRAGDTAAFTTARSDWQKTAEKRLNHVIRLKQGWDGYSGRPTNPTIADYTYRLLETLLLHPKVPLPEITPLSYGGLILEWHRNGWDVEIEIEGPSMHVIHTRELATDIEADFRLGAALGPLDEIIRKIAD